MKTHLVSHKRCNLAPVASIAFFAGDVAIAL